MVTIAAASILSGILDGTSLAEARAVADADLLQALQAELRPSRVGCALLPLQVVREALG